MDSSRPDPETKEAEQLNLAKSVDDQAENLARGEQESQGTWSFGHGSVKKGRLSNKGGGKERN